MTSIFFGSLSGKTFSECNLLKLNSLAMPKSNQHNGGPAYLSNPLNTESLNDLLFKENNPLSHYQILGPIFLKTRPIKFIIAKEMSLINLKT